MATERDLQPSKIGARLREERERRGVSLRELARRVGVSPSLVSQIELDRVNPSVSTLYALVTELGMTMSAVFGDAEPVERVVRLSSGSDGVLEGPEMRRVINLASGVRWERLTPHSDPDVEFLYVVYPVGAESRLWAIGEEPVHAIWVVIGRASDPRATALPPPGDRS